MSRHLNEKQREAKRAYEREWRKRKYAEDPDYRARKKITDEQSRQRLIAEVITHKLTVGCAQCGYQQCSRALHFHHRETDKLFNVSSALSSRKSKKRIFEEINKCSVLCANCHAERHCESSC